MGSSGSYELVSPEEDKDKEMGGTQEDIQEYDRLEQEIEREREAELDRKRKQETVREEQERERQRQEADMAQITQENNGSLSSKHKDPIARGSEGPAGSAKL